MVVVTTFNPRHLFLDACIQLDEPRSLVVLLSFSNTGPQLYAGPRNGRNFTDIRHLLKPWFATEIMQTARSLHSITSLSIHRNHYFPTILAVSGKNATRSNTLHETWQSRKRLWILYIIFACLQSLPRVRLSSALCSCGCLSDRLRLAAWAHTMNAFIGRFTRTGRLVDCWDSTTLWFANCRCLAANSDQS